MHSCPLSHKYEQLFVIVTHSKSIIFRVKNTFEPNVFKWVIIRNLVRFDHHFATTMRLLSKPTTFATMIFVILCVHAVASIYHYMCN
jgi:hypothetical protein